jgi:hypothetical protein
MYLSSNLLISALTTTGVLLYGLTGFLDLSPDAPIDQMVYRADPLRDCSLQRIGVADPSRPATTAQAAVHPSFLILI